ncbi:FadR/GntR family transcriptional regulator [Clostridium polynesiense]|uniref:FadR/GntR family transcriptional regulator n=1 Tax=Clostridium polynesiense TaxID=1325933 RepID=UPI0005905420|nr:FadR/GntR family transcriptional regulator [Clostridium polynesiense]
MFKQVKSQNLSEMVVKQIIELIEAEELKPGDKLPPENIFADELGVSRGILREALTILQFQGFISRKPKDGTYIRELGDYKKANQSITESLKDATYMDLIEVREALELRTVELAIERARDEEIIKIKDYLNSINIDDKNYNIMDYNFHLKIAELSKNILLINFIDNYYGLIEELGEKSNKKAERKQEIIDEHKSLINAIYSRNVKMAKEALTYHLRKVREIISKNDITKGGNNE